MKETPNKDNPLADIEFIIQELYDLFEAASPDSAIELDDNCMELRSHVGSTFHARVVNAARHLGILIHDPETKKAAAST